MVNRAQVQSSSWVHRWGQWREDRSEKWTQRKQALKEREINHEKLNLPNFWSVLHPSLLFQVKKLS